MDKVKVNNQVVKMRKHVKRAKLFAINKFTKQLKLLQNKKGNDSQAEKNQRKVERLLEKVKILKKMMPDFVSKKALSKAQDWNTLLSQKNVPLDDQCLALLANDNEVKKEVEKFHAEECQLVEKIPSLLLEWEMKSKMPKSPDKKKTASDIKKQKLDKMAKRKMKNFKGATFPNNVAVDKRFNASDNNKKMLPGRAPKNLNADFNDESEMNESENPESIEDNLSNNVQLNSELSNDSSMDESEEFFTIVAESNKNHTENPEPGEDDSNGKDQLNSELPSEHEPEIFFRNDAKSKNHFLSKKEVNNTTSDAKLMEDPPGNINSSEEESRDTNRNNVKNSFPPKIDLNKDSATCPQTSIFERLKTLANTNSRTLKAKNRKLNSTSQNTKAIKVLDLNELQNSEQISIQNISTDSQELATPQSVAPPKNDSFFLNGDEEVESSGDEESNTNNYQDSKHRFSSFDRNERDGKFKRNNFGDKPRKSFNGFNKGKDFNPNENRFQRRNGRDFNRNENGFNKGKDCNPNENSFQRRNGRDFNRNENGFQNKSGKDFKRGENKFQKNIRGNSQSDSLKKFDNKSKGNPCQFSHPNPSKMNDSSFQKRENKKNMISDPFQSKKQSNEKGEKNVQLHPSWQAKNKLKEAAKSGFKGKRTVFN